MEEIVSVRPSKRRSDTEYELNTFNDRFRSEKQSPASSRSVMKGNVVSNFYINLICHQTILEF